MHAREATAKWREAPFLRTYLHHSTFGCLVPGNVELMAPHVAAFVLPLLSPSSWSQLLSPRFLLV